MAGAKKASALSPAVRKLAALPILVVLGTKRDDGSVQLNPVWFELKDGFFWLNSNTGRLWPKNLQRDRELTMLLVDPKTPDRYAQIKGRLVSLIPDPTAGAIASTRSTTRMLGAGSPPWRRGADWSGCPTKLIRPAAPAMTPAWCRPPSATCLLPRPQPIYVRSR